MFERAQALLKPTRERGVVGGRTAELEPEHDLPLVTSYTRLGVEPEEPELSKIKGHVVVPFLDLGYEDVHLLFGDGKADHDGLADRFPRVGDEFARDRTRWPFQSGSPPYGGLCSFRTRPRGNSRERVLPGIVAY